MDNSYQGYDVKPKYRLRAQDEEAFSSPKIVEKEDVEAVVALELQEVMAHQAEMNEQDSQIKEFALAINDALELLLSKSTTYFN